MGTAPARVSLLPDRCHWLRCLGRSRTVDTQAKPGTCTCLLPRGPAPVPLPAGTPLTHGLPLPSAQLPSLLHSRKAPLPASKAKESRPHCPQSASPFWTPTPRQNLSTGGTPPSVGSRLTTHELVGAVDAVGEGVTLLLNEDALAAGAAELVGQAEGCEEGSSHSETPEGAGWLPAPPPRTQRRSGLQT